MDIVFEENEKKSYLKSAQEWVESQSDSVYASLYQEQMKFIETNAIEHLVANSFVSYNDDRKPETNTSYISVEAAVQHPVSVLLYRYPEVDAIQLSRGSIHIQSQVSQFKGKCCLP